MQNKYSIIERSLSSCHIMTKPQEEINTSQKKEEGGTGDHSVKKRQKIIHPSIKLYKIPPPPLPCCSCCFALSLLAVVFLFLVPFLFLLSLPFFFVTAIVHSLTHSAPWGLEHMFFFFNFWVFRKGVWVWGLGFWVFSPSGRHSHSMWHFYNFHPFSAWFSLSFWSLIYIYLHRTVQLWYKIVREAVCNSSRCMIRALVLPDLHH